MANKISDSVDGYSLICPDCNDRHGENRSGPRDLDIKLCKSCRNKRLEIERIRAEESVKKEPSPEEKEKFVKKMKQAKAERNVLQL